MKQKLLNSALLVFALTLFVVGVIAWWPKSILSILAFAGFMAGTFFAQIAKDIRVDTAHGRSMRRSCLVLFVGALAAAGAMLYMAWRM